MDAYELLTIIERNKLAHLTKVAEHERNDELEKSRLHSLAFDALDTVTTEFSNSSEEAAAIVDQVNTLVIQNIGEGFAQHQRKAEALIPKDVQDALRELLEEKGVEFG